MVVTLVEPISHAVKEREKIFGIIVMCLGTKKLQKESRIFLKNYRSYRLNKQQPIVRSIKQPSALTNFSFQLVLD